MLHRRILSSIGVVPCFLSIVSTADIVFLHWYGHCNAACNDALLQDREMHKNSAIEAVVQKVDPINRELIATIDDVPMTIYVPPGCNVLLRGERVKLRLVQARDRVRIHCRKVRDALVATDIVVQPAYQASSYSA
jgi:hypothetical protein